jgi:phosphoribosylformylglycinamidine synthase
MNFLLPGASRWIFEELMAKPVALLLTGYGINSQAELAHSFALAGAEPRLAHLHDVLEGKVSLVDADILGIPGGFSFGDHIASGKVFANKIRFKLGDALLAVRAKRMPVIGICNGFQVLVKLGLLPGDQLSPEGKPLLQPSATLTFNASSRFEDRWCHVATNTNSACIWLRGTQSLYLPVRHGEGRFIASNPEQLSALQKSGQACLTYSGPSGEPLPEAAASYPADPNGSQAHVAGLSTEDGLVFGLMPHPEAHVLPTQHPHWTRVGLKEEGEGLPIFRNAVEYVRG